MRSVSPVFILVIAACGGPVETSSYEVPELAQTTDGAIAKSNLDGAIRRAALQGARAEISLLLQRAQFFGTFDDLDRADTLSRALLVTEPDDEARILRATVLTRLHRFNLASEVLDDMPIRSASVVALRSTIAAAVGDDATPVLEAAEYPRLYTHHFGTWAIAHASRGDFDAADAEYRLALEAYRDVGPMPPAGYLFAMGVMWSERAGLADRGLQLYTAAVERLPGFVTANVHLAELEAETDLDAAIDRLLPLVDVTQDPEPASRLSSWFAEKNDPGNAERYRAIALAGYEDLLARHPEAFADHATEFFLGAGNDADRALTLALLNLDQRKTPRAFALTIRAAAAAERMDLACAYYRDAIARHPNSIELEAPACSDR